MKNDNVILLRDATKAWVSVAELPSRENEIFILTPYVTGSIIKDIIKASGSKTVHLITSLNAQSVVAKSLDLELIRELLFNHVKIYSNDKLHAKILINGDQAIIGSQNFTTGGKYNQEASVHLKLTARNQQNLAEIINDIIAGSTYLTLREIDKFQHLCKRYFEELNQFNATLNRINHSLKADQEELITNELNSEKKVFLESPCTALDATVQTKSWLGSSGQKKEYLTISISKSGRNLLDAFAEAGVELEKRSIVPVYDISQRNMFYGELHQWQLTKLATKSNAYAIEPQSMYPEWSFPVKVLHRAPALIHCVPPNESPQKSNICFRSFHLEEEYQDESSSHQDTSYYCNKYYFRFSLFGSTYTAPELRHGDELDTQLLEEIKNWGEEMVMTPPRIMSDDNRVPSHRYLIKGTRLKLKPWLHPKGYPILLIDKRKK